MPRPNAAWEKKYGKNKGKVFLLTEQDTVLSAVKKLASGVSEAEAILLQMLRYADHEVLLLLDMDDMQLHGHKIVEAYHKWSGNDYKRLVDAIKTREATLIAFIASV